MAQLILDMSANTFGDDLSYIMQMMDEIKAIDTGKYEIIFKTQLFKSAPPNIPLNPEVFDFMYYYGKKLGYQVTSSVFDKESLNFLLKYDVPMVKIANNRNLDYLIEEIPRKIPIYISVDNVGDRHKLFNEIDNIKILACVSKYPATENDYNESFGSYLNNFWFDGISDHNAGTNLFKKYQPNIWEKHYVLEHDSNNPDGGLFSATIDELKEIL
jgi:sialic acid synthase SpsE